MAITHSLTFPLAYINNAIEKNKTPFICLSNCWLNALKYCTFSVSHISIVEIIIEVVAIIEMLHNIIIGISGGGWTATPPNKQVKLMCANESRVPINDMEWNLEVKIATNNTTDKKMHMLITIGI